MNRIAGWPAHGHRAPLGALRLGDGEGLGRLPETPAAERCALHPEALEAGLRVLTATVAGDEHPEGWTVSGVRRIHARASLDRATWVYARERTDEAATTRVGDLWFLDDAGGSVLELHGVRFAPSGAIDDLVHGVEWQLRPCSAAGPTRSRARWLIVGEPDELLPALVARLEAAGDALRRPVGGRGPRRPCRRRARVRRAPLRGLRSPRERRRRAARVRRPRRLPPTSGGRVRWPLCRPWPVAPRPGRRDCGSSPAAPSVRLPIDRSASLGAAAVWGLGAVVAYEHPALAGDAGGPGARSRRARCRGAGRRAGRRRRRGPGGAPECNALRGAPRPADAGGASRRCRSRSPPRAAISSRAGSAPSV